MKSILPLSTLGAAAPFVEVVRLQPGELRKAPGKRWTVYIHADGGPNSQDPSFEVSARIVWGTWMGVHQQTFELAALGSCLSLGAQVVRVEVQNRASTNGVTIYASIVPGDPFVQTVKLDELITNGANVTTPLPAWVRSFRLSGGNALTVIEFLGVTGTVLATYQALDCRDLRVIPRQATQIKITNNDATSTVVCAELECLQ